MSKTTVQDQATTLRRLKTRSAPPVLAITSGKGGAGKTVLAVNLALRFAATGTRTLLIDLDPGLANIDVHMRLHANYTVDDVLAGRCEPEDAVLVGPSGLLVVPGGSAFESATHAHASRGEPARLLTLLASILTTIDLVILDTGAGIGPWVIGALELADHSIVVTQPDPASVTDAYAIIKLSRRLQPNRTPALAINRVRDKREALLTATRLRKIAARFLSCEPELLGWLHEQPQITNSVKNQLPFLLDLPTAHRSVLDLGGLHARIAGRVQL